MFDDKIEALNATPAFGPVSDMYEKKTYTVTEIQDILGISMTTAYALIKRKEFHSVNVGRHIRVSKASFDAWLNGQMQ
ncbi:MAG: helix-turn-helix domain-containing protein [Oscillospiraceae bacterium]|nr:helix-turn-helix domain-containing protein [Oscillospiraceae bacterium]